MEKVIKISLEVEPGALKRFDDVAGKRGISRAAAVRLAMQDWMIREQEVLLRLQDGVDRARASTSTEVGHG